MILDVYGKKLDLTDEAPADSGMTMLQSFKAIVRGGYLKRTLMCGALYFAQITPQYAMLTFLPVILAGFAVSSDGSAV